MAEARAGVTKDGIVDKRSKLVRQEYLIFKEADPSKVDKRCAAFKQGLVDEEGRPIAGAITPEERQRAVDGDAPAGSGLKPTVFQGKGRPRETDYDENGNIIRTKAAAEAVEKRMQEAASASSQKSTPTPMPSAVPIPTTPAPSAIPIPTPPAISTVYAGAGRPKDSDYNADGSLNRGSGSSSASAPTIYSGSGRPKDSDYAADGSIYRGDSHAFVSSPSPSSGGATGATTVYCGHGRPPDSAYHSDGSINRGSGGGRR